MVGGCRLSTTEFHFDRGLSPKFLDALGALTEADSPQGRWWRDLITHPDLIRAIRKDSLDFYYLGQRIFHVAWDKGLIVPKTHFKYLVRQKQDYIRLQPDSQFAPDPKAFMWSEYKSPATLKDMLKAASVYAGPEKMGLHALIKNSLSDKVRVIDVEVSFTRDEEGDTPSEDWTAPTRHLDRIDVVTQEERDGSTCFVFHEAKHFTNKELRASSKSTPPVVEQIERYRRAIQKHKAGIERTYKKVLFDQDAITSLAQKVSVKGYDRKERIQDCPAIPSSSHTFQVDPDPRLIIFGFDQDQKKGEIWNKHYDRLHGEFCLTVYAAGDPKSAKGAFLSPPSNSQ
jgi:hypothetical protein